MEAPCKPRGVLLLEYDMPFVSELCCLASQLFICTSLQAANTSAVPSHTCRSQPKSDIPASARLLCACAWSHCLSLE